MATINSSPPGTPIPSSNNVIPPDEKHADLPVFHSTVSSTIQLVQRIPKLVAVKLDDGNFLIWKQQVLTASNSRMWP